MQEQTETIVEVRYPDGTAKRYTAQDENFAAKLASWFQKRHGDSVSIRVLRRVTTALASGPLTEAQREDVLT